MDDFWKKFEKQDMTKEEQDVLGKELAGEANKFVPAILSFGIVLLVGFTLTPQFELYLEKSLLTYINNQLIVTIIIFALAFGPILLVEEKIERLITKIIKRYYLKK